MKIPSLEIVRSLREQLRGIEASSRPVREAPISSGCAGLDHLLPGEGFWPGQLVEWLAEGPGSGAGTLAMVAARQACQRDGGALVVADRARDFYPPAAVAWGIDWQQLIVVRAGREKDLRWALDQSLRCPGVTAVWAPLERLDQRSFRRLKLAVESGGGLGLLLRPARVRGQPSWSDVQLLVQPQPCLPPQGASPASWRGRRVRVQLVRGRGALTGGMIELEIDETRGSIQQTVATRQARATDHETQSMYLAGPLAPSAAGRRAAQA
jgi:hypothetical protein